MLACVLSDAANWAQLFGDHRQNMAESARSPFSRRCVGASRQAVCHVQRATCCRVPLRCRHPSVSRECLPHYGRRWGFALTAIQRSTFANPNVNEWERSKLYIMGGVRRVLPGP